MSAIRWNDAIVSIFAYVREAGQNRVTAECYIERTYDCSERIGDAPFGVAARSDVGANPRLAAFERSIVIVYVVEDDVVINTSPAEGITKHCCGGTEQARFPAIL
jgi:toxin ParE1/3/4